MDLKLIREKFGDDYTADSHTFKMGIDRRITLPIAKRFKNRIVLETCTGAGFTTISLAREAAKVITVDINRAHQKQAIKNAEKAKVKERILFVTGDTLNDHLLKALPRFDSAFIDPDWADTAPGHTYRFLNSNTKPPADILLEKIISYTQDAALILPPAVNTVELKSLPPFELQKIFLDGDFVLYCLYFGHLISSIGKTELYV